MCGIVGYWTRQSDQALREAMPAALESIRLRGPDDVGSWFNGAGVGFGHRRLSILDLSAAGHQPMLSANGRRAIVYNGEVYNFRAIRKELETLGHVFRGSGDTEVVLAALSQWGLPALERFIGMFAIAFWDEDARRLWLIRDRLGVKPLYYGWNGETLWFGSELKALRAFTHWRPEIDKDALGEYFRYQYINAPRTIYRNVFKLPAGHVLELDGSGAPRTSAYWSVMNALRTPLAGDDEALAEQLEALMKEAFSYRMVSDVPVGVFLSGGVDSSIVTAILQKQAAQPVHTFTIGFNEPSYDESKWARKVAEHLGTVHTEYILGVDAAKRLLPEWGDLYDEPFADSSGIPTLLVSRVAAGSVKVVLSADGGDELFCGYSHYRLVLDRQRTLARLPAWLRRTVAGGLSGHTPDFVGRVLGRFGGEPGIGGQRRMRENAIKLRRVLPDAGLNEVYDVAMCYWQPPEVRSLLGCEGASEPGADRFPGSAADQLCLWDLHRYLPEDILTKVDRATMSASIEGREPMLDHRLVEFAFRLPLHLRAGALGPKHILRKILYKYVPRDLVERPKQGFAVPVTRWLQGDLKPLVQDYLNERRVTDAGILDPAAVRGTLAYAAAGSQVDEEHLWSLLAFEMWREKWG